MNWGHYITIAFTLFVAFIMYMVISAFNVNIDLVTEDYYSKEIAYDAKMIQKANFAKLGVKVDVNQKASSIELVYPVEIISPSGEIEFYHTSRRIFDKTFKILPDSNGKQIIDRKELVAGNYRINFSWKSEGKEYFQQSQLLIK